MKLTIRPEQTGNVDYTVPITCQVTRGLYNLGYFKVELSTTRWEAWKTFGEVLGMSILVVHQGIIPIEARILAKNAAWVVHEQPIHIHLRKNFWPKSISII